MKIVLVQSDKHTLPSLYLAYTADVDSNIDNTYRNEYSLIESQLKNTQLEKRSAC